MDHHRGAGFVRPGRLLAQAMAARAFERARRVDPEFEFKRE